ncbi:DNA-binding response regulator [Haloferax sp. Atlit-10N]|uniref:Response regulator / transcription regulator n=1 Tax=Haloferax prahovense (strain DSM 18310 / JCM 13924 / TL6) TaxID=1227461 RepID=M0GHR6_HALPT|nr:MULTISPECIES: response regulator [Haloferax]ELZ71796.1 response regulator / transcription regulator [Haloferax prahovense DSM 18310]RDZ45648.1 DNA-binding response regulator [Haloferax sp. Atlit-19N]RDZ47082.1 DNA-binding response regulator [Haloferax sp. Atlit-16N]RDZ60913.1 DNA-binding response regulator [Haloferax sp. Atlit-10N]REA05050.1 DNA-binding response regulator [Haloferax sp. Atlit-6N]
MTQPPTPDAPTVLLVDDEAALADSLALWLERRYRVRVAYSGREALQTFDESVDLVFLDHNLPGLSGESVLEELSRRVDPSSFAVVMLSAAPGDELADLPVDAVLTKPVTKRDVFDAADRFVGDAPEAKLD